MLTEDGCIPEVQYYDGVVDSCQNCADVCLSCTRDTTFCVSNCAEYFKKMCIVSRPGSPTKTHIFTKRPASTNQPIDGSTLMDTKSNKTPLYQNPLFWLSISCLALAFTATAAMVVVVLVCYRKRNTGRSSVETLLSRSDRQAYSRSASEGSTENGSMGEKRNALSACEHDLIAQMVQGKQMGNSQHLV
jgi:hypothetical protein